MFRTVTVYRGEKIAVRQGWLVVSSEAGEQKLPLEDIYSLVVDNQQTVLTTAAITQLTASGAHILVCDEKHLPNTLILPHNTHYHPLTVIRRQIALPADIRDQLWDRIVKAKIINDGYDMLQYSVYSRIAQNHDDARKHMERLKKNLPPKGSVRVMQVTEKQYNAMELLVGERTATEDFLTPVDFTEL